MKKLIILLIATLVLAVMLQSCSTTKYGCAGTNPSMQKQHKFKA